MANEPSKTPTPQPQIIPLAKIHDLPGAVVSRQPDKSYGGLVTSIQAGGVKEPVVLRLREDGEYELVTGYRRRRACELAKVKGIPALVYEMSMPSALNYHRQVKNQPGIPIPGKPVPAPGQGEKGQTADLKGPEKPTTPPAQGTKPADQGQQKPNQGKGTAQAAAPADKAKDGAKPAQEPKPADQGQQKPAEGKDTAQTAAPAAADKAKDGVKPAQEPKPAQAPAVTGPSAKGPTGTAISQVLPERLSPPDEAAKKDFPLPNEGESIFVVLHPAYLVKSEYNTISVDTKSEDYLELKKSIELNGVKDPVLARIGDKGTLEIISGQRRHMIATELNYPVPAIIQKISDADAKILVADGNLHRPKISTYDLARSLRMKMEGMKQKSGRRKKGTFKAEELDSDVKLAQEMGMPVSKLNRLIRMSEATKDLCDRVDDNSLNLSLAHAISFLKPENQDEVLHQIDLGAKVPVERVEYMKKTEKKGKLNEKTIRDILDGKNVLDPPKQETAQPQPSAPAASDIPPSPDVAQPAPAPDAPAAAQPGQTPEGPAPAASAQGQSQEGQEPVDGKQERPEYTKVVLAGDRLRKYFPDVMMTPREIEESIYEALEERRQRQQKQTEKMTIFPKRGPKH